MDLQLPPSINATEFDAVIQAFEGVVGSDWVLVSAQDRDAYSDIYAPGPKDEWPPSGAVAPGTVEEIHLLQNGRVLAAAASAATTFDLLGDVFGGGPVTLTAEAEFDDGGRAVSAPVSFTVTYANPPAGGTPNTAPVAYDYRKDVPTHDPILVELPASDLEDGDLVWTVQSPPTQATIASTSTPAAVI